MIKFILFLILVRISFGLSILTDNNQIQMIVDIINCYDKPTAVIAKVCWKPTKKVKLMSFLANANNSKSVLFLSNINAMENYMHVQHILFLADNECQDIRSFFEQANTTKKFGNPYRWLIFGNHMNTNDIIPPELEDISILVDSEVVVARKTKNDNEFILNTIYKVKFEGDWQVENFGTWKSVYGLNRSKDMDVTTAIRRKNLKRTSIAVSVVATDNRTKTELFELNNILIDTLSKSTIRQIIPLYDFMNATTVIVFSDTWGYFINGTWNGMIGSICRGEAELGGTIAFINKQRLEVLDFLSQPCVTSPKIIFRDPPLSYQNNLFLLPFKATVWYSTGGFILILIVVLYINARWESKKTEKYSKKALEDDALRPYVSDVAILIVSAISQQGTAHEFKGTLGRVVMLILFMAFLFLYTSYSANIVVLLQSTSKEIRTLSDLLHSKLEVGVEEASYNRYLFSTETEPVRKAIYDTKIAPKGYKPNFMGLEEGVKKLQTEPFAFNMNIGVGYRLVEKYFYEHEKCGLREIVYIQDDKPLLTCRKNSPYREIYKIGYFRIKEHGLNDRQNRLIYVKKPLCSMSGGSFGSVNMMDFYPVLLMLLYGMIVSIVMLLIEKFVYHKKISLSCREME